MRARWTGLFLAIGLGHAVAEPLPALAVDVDGDGAVDQVRIEAPGQLVVERKGAGQLVPFGASGALTEARLTAVAPFVVGSARIDGRWEAIALRAPKGGGPMIEVWRGEVGPAGDDDEYERWVAAEAEGLVRFQARADQRRCDGVPIELFRERWDGRGFVGAAPQPIGLPSGTPVVVAKPARGGVAGGWYRAVAASTRSGATDASMLTAPRGLDDGDVATAWTGAGRGTVWSYRASVAGGQAAVLRIVGASARGTVRPSRLAVIGARGAVIVEVPDAPAGVAYEAVLPTPIAGCVSVAVLDVGRGRGATALAELVVLADVELTPDGAAPILAAQVVTGGLAGESAARALIARGPASVPALLAALTTAKGAARGRLLAALAQLHDAAVIEPLAAALVAGELGDRALVDATATLSGLGTDGAQALRDAIASPLTDEASRIAAADALASIDRGALVALVGRGRPSFRAALTRLLAPLGTTALVAAAQAGPDELAQADLWRAVALATDTASASAAERAAAASAMLAALGQAGADRYELRYRLIAGIGALGSGDQLRALASVVAGLPDDPYGHGLARVAARALAENSDGAAQVGLAGLATADDPGIRLESIRGLAIDHAGGSTTDGDRALIAALTGDAWPAVRRAATAALGLRCGRAEPRDALVAAIAGDAEVPVRVDAVTALARCPTPDLDTRLLALADDAKTPLPVRDRALAAFAERPRGAAVDVAVVALLTRFTRWRSQAFSDEPALAMAIRAATALGTLGDGRAGPALVETAADTAFPELAAAAIRALGALGPACPRTAPALLRSLVGNQERQIALAARSALARCR